MKKMFFGLFFALSTSIIAAPFFALAAPALDDVPDAVKSKYSFTGGEILSIVSDGTTLYVGGNFTGIELRTPPPGDPPEVSRSNLAAIDLTTYEVISGFNPQPNYGVRSLALSGHGTLYVGGDFTCFGAWDEGEGICSGDERLYLAAIDATDGSILDAFSPEPDATVNALALSSDDSVLYAGGSFYAGDMEYIAEYTTADRTGTAFDAEIDDEVMALALSSDDSVVYAGGYFTTVNGGVPQAYLAAFESGTGNATDFNASFGDLNPFVSALALSSNDTTLYVGGSFLDFVSSVGEGIPFNETTQVPVATYPKVSTTGGGGGGGGATVYAAIPDGDGGWYIGGSFTNVGTTTQQGLAHITGEGIFDGAFNPVFIGDATIYALELSPDGTLLYAGGSFLSGDEQYAAAFNTIDGSLAAFDPYPSATVYDLELSADGETLYLAGEFGSVTSDYDPARYNVAAFDTTGVGTPLAFDPQLSDVAYALQLSDDENTLYIGGAFTNVNTETTNDVRNRIAAFSTAGAGTMTAFNPNASADVFTLLLNGDDSKLYVGGSFATIGGQSRNEFAELNTSDGTATALDAGIAGPFETVLALGLSSDASTIYIGGESFTQIGGAEQQYFGEIDVTDGLLTDFNPKFNGAVRTIAVDSVGGEVYIGGSFTGMNAADVSNLIALGTTDSSLVTAFDPDVNNTVRTLSLSSDDTLLYAGGDFTDVNIGTTREYLVALDTTDGAATAFDPTGEVLYGYATALKGDDTELYFGSYDADDTGNSELLVFDAGAVEADVTPPVITLLGSTPVNLTVGDVYVDAGATAEDDVDGDITADIVMVNPVDTNTVGTYVVTYNVEDAAGNPATEVTRTVNVSAAGGGDDGGGGGSGSSRVHTLQTANPIIEILSKLIVTLQELIILLQAQQH